MSGHCSLSEKCPDVPYFIVPQLPLSNGKCFYSSRESAATKLVKYITPYKEIYGQQVQFSIVFECTVTAKDDKKDEKVETCEKEVALKQPSHVPNPTPKKREEKLTWRNH